MELESLISEYHEAQDALLDRLHADHPGIALEPNPQRWPQRGALTVDGVTWRFHRHGFGFTFESEHGEVVNAHEFVTERPYAIDAYRLQLYCESKGITRLRINARIIDVADLSSIERSLQQLCLRGLLKRDERSAGRYLGSYVTMQTYG